MNTSPSPPSQRQGGVRGHQARAGGDQVQHEQPGRRPPPQRRRRRRGYPHGPRRALSARILGGRPGRRRHRRSRRSRGGGLAGSSSAAIATARRKADGSGPGTSGRVEPASSKRRLATDRVGKPRRRRGRAASSSGTTTGTGRGAWAGSRRLRRVSPAWAPTTVSGDAAESRAPSTGDTQPEKTKPRGPTIRHSIGTGAAGPGLTSRRSGTARRSIEPGRSPRASPRA